MQGQKKNKKIDLQSTALVRQRIRKAKIITKELVNIGKELESLRKKLDRITGRHISREDNKYTSTIVIDPYV